MHAACNQQYRQNVNQLGRLRQWSPIQLQHVFVSFPDAVLCGNVFRPLFSLRLHTLPLKKPTNK